MKSKIVSVFALLIVSTAAMAWTGPYNGWGNNGNFFGDGNFGFSMNANANGNGAANNGYNNGYYNGWGNNGWGTGNGEGSFSFNMGGSAHGNGNGWGNNYYAPYYGTAPYAPAMTQDQYKAQQEAAAEYYKKMENDRKAFEAAQRKAYDHYVARMEKRFAK